MNRRAFFASLSAAFALDPEKALWVPGKKLISIPKPKPLALGWASLKIGDTIIIRRPRRFFIPYDTPFADQRDVFTITGEFGLGWALAWALAPEPCA